MLASRVQEMQQQNQHKTPLEELLGVICPLLAEANGLPTPAWPAEYQSNGVLQE